MEFTYHTREHWAPLAWLVRLREGADAADVYVGGSVEHERRRFCEGVWETDFAEGRFRESDLFFGSGGIAEKGTRAIFVSACAPFDRLHSLQIDGETCVSNSLPCLLAFTGAEVDPAYTNWPFDCRSTRQGVHEYTRGFPTSKGEAMLSYCHDLAWDGMTLQQLDKHLQQRRFASFEEYKAFLRDTLRGMADNMAHPARRIPLTFTAGISRGYDSLTVCVLARDFGLTESYTCRESRYLQKDDGSELGHRLGLEVHAFERVDWRKAERPDVPFIVANGLGHGIEISAIADRLRHRVVLSGELGDRVWAIKTDPDDFRDFRHRSYGVYFTEFRLWAVCVHVPVPFFGYASLADIVRISQSEAMKAWDLSRTDDPEYSRPICRRIIEEAGIGREEFATRKMGAAVLGWDMVYTRPSMREIDAFNKAHASAWRCQGRRPPTPNLPARAGLKIVHAAAETLIAVARRLPDTSSSSPRVLLMRLGLKWHRFENQFRQPFGWGFHHAAERYRDTGGSAPW